MRKQIVAILIAGSLLIGIFLGAFGMYYVKFIAPYKKVQAIVQKQQKELERSVRSGEVLDVKPGEFTMRVESSGESSLIGKELVVKVDDQTTFQAGMNLLNKPGEAVDMSEYLKPGQKVDVMERDGLAAAVHWSAQ